MKTILTSLKFTVLSCVLLFVGYVLVLWGIAAIATPSHGEIGKVELNGKVVGTTNVGQSFTRPEYFWGRPSAVDYDGGASGGSNKGPSNPEYLQEVNKRINAFLKAHPYLKKLDIPSEMVTASGSGLDPHISPRAAEIQIFRVAKVRHLPVQMVSEIVKRQTHQPLLGLPYINVLELNVALEKAGNN